ncbi:MAG: bifunctional pyr operon transcriptional regulator/uracil phosphoribosyltransferase PyrR [Candidatus Sumerlaeia bacterium]|nr:bifunctional pyr operon transcriptional regulator/uracil phosphoribosyltransferase PyrR [Candidatus Sumerlaeia bacterium]
MNANGEALAPARELMSGEQLAQALEALADRIVADFPGGQGMMVLGIRTRGAIIAKRLQQALKARYDISIGYGTLDITLYRDDLSPLRPQPEVGESELPFDVSGATVILVDDVLYTGRTIRAALDEIVDFGRPAYVRLAVVVDRGLREYPIQPDYASMKIETNHDQKVRVLLSEMDEQDRVVMLETADPA